MVYENQKLNTWHLNKNVINNERLSDTEKIPVGNFVFEENKWFFVNQNGKSIKDLTEGIEVPISGRTEITNGKNTAFCRRRRKSSFIYNYKPKTIISNQFLIYK